MNEDGTKPGTTGGEGSSRQRWLIKSLRNPDNLPHYLTALFTLALAVFAIFAWIEARNSAGSLEGQLRAMKADQRPFLWLHALEQPTFMVQPEQRAGTIAWNIQTINSGKGVAYNVAIKSYVKVGGERYELSSDLRPDDTLWVESGVSVPPGKVNFFTATSRPGFSQDYFEKLGGQDDGFGILIEFSYTDSTREEKYFDAICLDRLKTSAFHYRNPKGCTK